MPYVSDYKSRSHLFKIKTKQATPLDLLQMCRKCSPKSMFYRQNKKKYCPKKKEVEKLCGAYKRVASLKKEMDKLKKNRIPKTSPEPLRIPALSDSKDLLIRIARFASFDQNLDRMHHYYFQSFK